MQIEVAGFFDLQVNGFGGVDFNDPRTTCVCQPAMGPPRIGGIDQGVAGKRFRQVTARVK